MTTVSPGQDFLVAVDFHNGSKGPLFIDGLKLEVPMGWGTISDKARRVPIKPGDDVQVVFRLRVPKDGVYTRPYWHRDDPETESVNHVDDESYVTLPFPPPVMRARVEYSVARASGARGKNGISATVATHFVDEAGKERARPVAVVPAFSVALEPGTQVISTHNGSGTTVAVGVTSNLNRRNPWHAAPGTSGRLALGTGTIRDGSDPVAAKKKISSSKSSQPVCRRAGRRSVPCWKPKLRSTARDIRWVTREDLGSFYYYQPAVQRVSIVDVKVPA